LSLSLGRRLRDLSSVLRRRSAIATFDYLLEREASEDGDDNRWHSDGQSQPLVAPDPMSEQVCK
jgi:hypothetical protein